MTTIKLFSLSRVFVMILAIMLWAAAVESFLIRWSPSTTLTTPIVVPSTTMPLKQLQSMERCDSHNAFALVKRKRQKPRTHRFAIGRVNSCNNRINNNHNTDKQHKVLVKTSGQHRRQVIAQLAALLGWSCSNARTAIDGTSWTTAAAAFDETIVSDSISPSSPSPPSSSSQFPLLDSADGVFKSKTIEITWDASNQDGFQGRFNVDAMNTNGTTTGSQVILSYQLPDRWKTTTTATTGSSNNINYFEIEKQAKACDHITVYQAPGDGSLYTSMNALQKAVGQVGVTKALHIPDWMTKSMLASADLLSARKVTKRGRTNNQNDASQQQQQDQTYLELEMASAPSNCKSASSVQQENDNDKLGLGLFCPYDTIYLLSATILNGQLYVMIVEASSEEWKRSNGDLKFVRSSFTVEERGGLL